MTSKEIRNKFLEFFEKKGHTVVRSDLLVPRNDPTLLFTGAGMNQFKDQFMGKNITFTRACSSQKCIRTGDIENVGKTPRHHTFFEMLGNFSFGDYFKKEAIQWGWEFMTNAMGIDEQKLWVSVYKDDEESYRIWLEDINMPPERIVKLGAKDNFWPADAPSKGPNGPCGPCSEIFYDWGKEKGCGEKECDPSCDCGRFVEVWNLVFTEFERKADGGLIPLPNKNIDTGMGLERIASVMQKVGSNFETDLFAPINKEIRKCLTGNKKELYDEDVYLIADHIRTVTFAICDGVSPSNEKRGYVVRKLIRRAYLRGGAERPFLYNLVPVVVEGMKDIYPELEEKREHISAIVKEEEKRFGDTLSAALPVLESMLEGNVRELDGGKIFKLVDTYGLPIEVIKEEMDAKGIKLDMDGFMDVMEKRREASRRGSDITSDFIFQPDHFMKAPKPEYSEDIPLKAKLEFMIKGDVRVDEIEEGDHAELITSPQSGVFYAESGGQVGDKGIITKGNDSIEILNTFESDGRTIFQVFVKKGLFRSGDPVTVDHDRDRKRKTANNHTATHLVQAALREVLGDHVKQSGSMVSDKRLRFDFTHMKKMTDREIIEVEDMVNDWIKEAIPVCKNIKSIKEAKKEGALSFFGEKYGDDVRVVSIGERSKELCGGTHVENTSEIGIIKIVNESSVASGIRRIEAVTGEEARGWVVQSTRELLNKIKDKALTMDGDEIVARAEKIAEDNNEITKEVVHDFTEEIRPALLDRLAQAEREAKKRQKEEKADVFNDAVEKVNGFVSQAVSFNDGVNLVSGILGDADMQILRRVTGHFENKLKSSVILLGASKEGKAYITCALTKDLEGSGISAKDLIDSISVNINGAGGGKATFAQAGGKNAEGLNKAIEEAQHILKERG